MFSGCFPKITAKKHFPPFLHHLGRYIWKPGIMSWALLFEHSHESGHLVQAVMGGEWVMILAEPAANAHSFFPKRLILGPSNAKSQWVADEADAKVKSLPTKEAKKTPSSRTSHPCQLGSQWCCDGLVVDGSYPDLFTRRDGRRAVPSALNVIPEQFTSK